MHFMLFHVNNDNTLVPEREGERDSVLDIGQILSEVLPNTRAVYLMSALNARRIVVLNFWLMLLVL